MTRWATPDERADHDRDLRKHEPAKRGLVRVVAQDAKRGLALSLASYVSDDDVELDRKTFLRSVCDRITDDLKAYPDRVLLAEH